MQYRARESSIDRRGPSPAPREVDGQPIDHEVEVIPEQYGRLIERGGAEGLAEVGNHASERNTLHETPPADLSDRVVFALHSNCQGSNSGSKKGTPKFVRL